MSTRRYKTGLDRTQADLFPARLDDYVDANNPVRAIDVYVESLDLVELGFTKSAPADSLAGQPPYPPSGLLKLYLYGYLNRVRSSRALERETRRNVELMWLLAGLAPTYKTIADFRKENAKALRQAHLQFILLCKELELFGRERVAVDGSFFKGNVSKKSFWTEKKLSTQIARLEEQLAQWHRQLDQADRCEAQQPAAADDTELQEKLERLAALQAKRQKLKDLGKSQHSEVDEQARLLSKNGQRIAGYNVQIGVESKNKLIVADELTNEPNDLHQLHPMSVKAKAVLDAESLEVLADAGYYSAAGLHACHQEQIVPYVPEPRRRRKAGREGRFEHSDFLYDAEYDRYRCPAGKLLRPSGAPRLQNGQRLQRYVSTIPACRDCSLRGQCLSAKSECREVWRGEYEADVKAHRERMQAHPERVRERGALVEHPFGTLKRRAGWDHFLVRGMEKVRGEWSLMAWAYNFSRVLALLGLERFREICLKRKARKGSEGYLTSRPTGNFTRFAPLLGL